MLTSQEILKQYFGYDTFREPQDIIIQSILDGNDTLALLPTGGGKSICFQVPALMQDGICVVVSPLIALMKDQVFQLKKRNIKAAAIFTGLSYNEIDIILDNCQFGYYKFLYVSPERLKTKMFIERFKLMKVNLIAVDEAHCISQWGFDFRPSYLEIAEIRKFHPKVPVLALTASATKKVQQDIVENLDFGKKYQVFKKSFLRENLSFVVRHEDAKLPKLIEIIQKIKGSGIVYVRSRSRAKDIAEYLHRNNINSDFYHAGLPSKERSKKQEDWINNKTNVIVCTNAFGMGIDKPDVRYVVHVDIPDSVEAYYQEAGRAGRDGKLSYAALLYGFADIEQLREKINQQFPSVEEIKSVYNALCNHLEIAIESGFMQTHNFDLRNFCQHFKLDVILVSNVLKILEQQNYIQLSDGVLLPSRAVFCVNNVELYKFEVANSDFSLLIKTMLRMYGGIIDHYTKISETQLAKQLNISSAEIETQLKFLQRNKILIYIASNDKPTVVLLTERMHENNLYIDVKYLNQRRQIIKAQIEAMLNFVEQKIICRQVLICNYFEEIDVKPCGRCDVCLEEKRKLEYKQNFKLAKDDILQKTNDTWLSIDNVLPQNAHFAKQLYKDVIRFMLDEKILMSNEKNEIKKS